MLNHQFAVGVGIVVLTTMVHALFRVIGHSFIGRYRARHGPVRHGFLKAVVASGLIAWQFVAVFTEALLWASLYLLHPLITALPDLETARYFSMATFTTVGYGDVVLEGSWRMLASLQAANGMIIFGWSTALIFWYLQCIYEERPLSSA